MNYSTYRASLDIHASGSQAVLHAKKGETKRRILITLTERGKPYLISSDCTAVFTATKPDGNIIYNDCAIDNNIICYNFTEQTTAAEGKLDCEIRLYGADNALIISPGFDLIVDAAVYEDGDVIESGTEVSALTALVSETNTLINTVNTKLENGEFNGPAGEAGGWYTPEIKQPIKGAMVVNFTPSKEGMPAAPGKNIILPQGETGETGGYYTPAVTQPDENTLRVAFTPSKENMPAVADTDITLPAGGGGGGSGEDGGYYAPSVDDEGNLTWTASKESMPAVDGANIKGQKGDNGGYYTPAVTQTAENTMQVAFTPSETTMPAVPGTEITLPEGTAGEPGADGKSAYQYAQEGGYTGTEAEFAAKLAQEKFASPNALTFTGAVTGSYDGSEAVTVEIPSGEGENAWTYEKITLEEAVNAWTIPIPSAKRLIIIPFLRANDPDNSLNTGSVSATFKVNNEYAGYPGVYLRNSARYYSLYDIEKVKAHTKVLYTGAFDNGIAYSVSKGLVVNGWLQTTADATEEITSVQFSLSTGYLFPADCTVEVWYK